MTTDPFQIFMMIILIAGFPFLAWGLGRITELMAAGEEKRVPQSLKSWANTEYVEAVRQGKTTPQSSYRLRFFVAVMGLILPIIMICSAKVESLIPRLLVIIVSAIVFFMGVALLEWLVRPRNR